MSTDPEGRPLRASADRRAPDAHRRHGGRLRWAKGALGSKWAAFFALAAAVVGFAGAWTRGALVIDGPGIAAYVRVALDHLAADGRVSYWMPEMWAGTPVWAIAPSFTVSLMVPLAAIWGPVTAVKAGVLALQVAGAWGAYVLARSLWDDGPAAFVAGIVYGLSPVVVSHGALAGSEPTVGAIAAMPWLVWSLRRGLRGDGAKFLVVAGLVAAFAVLHQAEYAYPLVFLCGCLLAMEVTRVRGLAAASVGRVLARAGLVVAISLGAVAHWLLPFLSLRDSFVLSPEAVVQGELLHGVAETVGRELGVFLNRSAVGGVVTEGRQGLVRHFLYLGWVPVAITVLTATLVARRDDDRTLSAVLLASAIGIWLSTGAVSLAEGGAVARDQIIALAAAGAVVGLIVGGFLRRLRLRRTTAPALAAVVALLVAAPYMTPYLLLQRAVPLLSSIRFPRFYVVAVLGVALGTAWLVARIRRRLFASHRRLAAVAASAVAFAVGGAVMADAWPYRSYYRLREPDADAAYRQASPTLATMPPGSRVAPTVPEARIVNNLLRAGADVSLGWPHPIAAEQLWHLTVEASRGPSGYRDRALGLSATAYTATEVTGTGTANDTVAAVNLRPNPRLLPLVRAYDQTLLVEDRSITPALAVSMSHRNVGVVTAGPRARRSLTVAAAGPDVPEGACDRASTSKLSRVVAGEVALACSMHRWLPTMFLGPTPFGGNGAPGAILAATADGLRGVSVWVADPSGHSQLVLRELAADGRSVGDAVARAGASGMDEYGMTLFAFDPIVDSAGKRYIFEIECPGCFSELAPQILAGSDDDGGGDLLIGGRLDRDHVAAFAPVYERLPPAPASTTTVRGEELRPGRWRLHTSGTQPSVVVVAEAHFPGWRARVDGRPATVVEVDGAFVGVPVAEGAHEVTLDYHAPVAVHVGRVITAGTLLTIVLTGLWSRRRVNRQRDELVESRGPDRSRHAAVRPAVDS